MIFEFDNHIHTVYSGHSDSAMTVGNIIKKSEEKGLSRIAITEHSFDWHMGPRKNVGLIKKELSKLSTRIKVNVGLEIDPNMSHPGRLNFDDFDRDELFPVLVGFHGYPGIAMGWFEKVNFTWREKKKIYSQWFKLLEKLIENPKVDILAHPGRIIMQNGIIEEFTGHVLKDFQRLALAAGQYNVAFEINEALLTSIPTEKLKQSYRDVISIMLEKKVKLSIGSDAHSLDRIGKFSQINDFIKTLNIRNKDLIINHYGEQNETEIHSHRTPRRDRDHRDTCQHAVACAEQGSG